MGTIAKRLVSGFTTSAPIVGTRFYFKNIRGFLSTNRF
jgi:hypothetical protein